MNQDHPLTCEECGLVFRDNYALGQHTAIHARKVSLRLSHQTCFGLMFGCIFVAQAASADIASGAAEEDTVNKLLEQQLLFPCPFASEGCLRTYTRVRCLATALRVPGAVL
jgi:hypothetical protein